MFALNRPRMDAVALIMLSTLPFTGVITISEALAGFSNPDIVLIAALFVLGNGLVRTGVARQLGDLISDRAGANQTKLLALLMVTVCLLGSVMSSTAITAIFIPVVLRIAQTSKTSPSQLMMPLSFAALISGMMTMIATAPNLVVNSELVRQGERGFHFFSFTPFGIPVLILGILYMIFVSRNFKRSAKTQTSSFVRPRLRDWVDQYHLKDREYRLQITQNSSLVGMKLTDVRLRDLSGANLVAIDRGGTLVQPTLNTELVVNDILFIDLFAANPDVDDLISHYALKKLPLTGSHFTDRSQEIGMVEVIVPPSSDLVGKNLEEADFRSKYQLTAVGLRRGKDTYEHGVRSTDLKSGDTLLVIGSWDSIRNLSTFPSEIVIIKTPIELDEVIPAASKAAPAVFCLVLVIALMISGTIPNVQAALLGCLLMGAFGCIDLNNAYKAIDWKTLVLIVGMLPFSLALQRTGGIELATDSILHLVGESGFRTVLAVIFATTAILGMFVSNTATAVLMAPIAISIARELGASPYPFAMTVALAASTAFMTPVSSPVNTLVVTPGNYSFSDFLKVGVPFSFIVLAISVLLVPIFLPF